MSLRAFHRAPMVLASILFTLATEAPALAQLPEMPLGKWWKRPRIVELLKLKPDQQERLDEIFSKNRRAFIDLKADVDRRAVDLEELLMKKGTDPGRISSATDSLEQAKSRLGKTRTMMIVEMKGVLSDEQWQRILELREEWRRERTEDHRDRRGAGWLQRMQQPGRGEKGSPTPGPSPHE